MNSLVQTLANITNGSPTTSIPHTPPPQPSQVTQHNYCITIVHVLYIQAHTHTHYTVGLTTLTLYSIHVHESGYDFTKHFCFLVYSHLLLQLL